MGTFCIFKTVYKIGEDVIGTFNFSGDIPCLQVSAGLGFTVGRSRAFGWAGGGGIGVALSCCGVSDEVSVGEGLWFSAHLDNGGPKCVSVSSCLFAPQFSVSLQTEESIQEEFQRRRGQPVSFSTHARHQEACLHTAQSSFSLPIPLSSTPGFTTNIGQCPAPAAKPSAGPRGVGGSRPCASGSYLAPWCWLLTCLLPAVSLKWRLHFEFVTSGESAGTCLVRGSQPEAVTWTGVEQIEVDTFSWDLPIKVLPTNPILASYVSQFSSTNSITI